MAENIRVSCIRKRGGHYNPHERIEGLGGIRGGARWYDTETNIIAMLEKKPAPDYAFYTQDDLNNKVAWVMVASRNGRKYLKTTNDGDEPNNLLALPECPR